MRLLNVKQRLAVLWTIAYEGLCHFDTSTVLLPCCATHAAGSSMTVHSSLRESSGHQSIHVCSGLESCLPTDMCRLAIAQQRHCRSMPLNGVLPASVLPAAEPDSGCIPSSVLTAPACWLVIVN
jgi:hypothetical protein